MNGYLDASVLLRLVLGEPHRLEIWRRFEQRVTSELTEVECLRTLDRLRLQHAFSEQENMRRRKAIFHLLESTDRVPLSRPILRRAAETLPVALGTLDALHLSTALTWQEESASTLVMATHDRALARAAGAYGFEVAGT